MATFNFPGGHNNLAVSDPNLIALAKGANISVEDLAIELQPFIGQIVNVINALNSIATDEALSAAQGKVLNDRLLAVETLLQSDDATLDTIQEIIDVIKINKEDLQNLTTENIAGLDLLLTGLQNSIDQLQTSLNNHTGRTDNPHLVTKAQVGLGNVNNTSDNDKPVSTAQQAALDNKQNIFGSTDILGTVSGNVNIDWLAHTAFTMDLSDNTTLVDANLPPAGSNAVRTIYINAGVVDKTLTLPAYWTKDINSDDFISSVDNRIVVECISGGASDQIVRYNISNLT